MTDSLDRSFSRRNWLGLVSTATVGSGLLAPAAFGAELRRRAAADHDLGARVYNVRDFGAKGDGATLDTAAVQAAVDACARDQGGTVLVPAGVFVIGMIELKSNVTLRIAAQERCWAPPTASSTTTWTPCRSAAIPRWGTETWA